MWRYQWPAGGQQQQGFTIVEALVAFLVLATGLLALLAFHGSVQRNNADARIQAEATALAEQKLNELASFITVDDARLAQITAGVCPGVEASGGFALSCDISGANPRDVRITVTWRDRDDNPQQTVVGSTIRLADPSQDAAGLLALVRSTVSEKDAVALWPAAVDDAGPGEGGSGPDDEGSDGEGSSGGDASGDDESEQPDEPGLPEPLTLHTRIISGAGTSADDGQGGALEIIAVAAHSMPPSISAHCSRPTSTSFRCAVTYADPRAGWSGTIALSVPGSQRLRSGPPYGAGCGSTITLSFTAVVQDIDDVSLSTC